MTYTSIHRYALMSPTKVRRVANAMVKKPYVEVIAYLRAMPHAGAKLIKKVVESAAANAMSHNKQIDESTLFIKSIIVNEGPRVKRMWPRARGRADVLLKRMSHIRVEVIDNNLSKEG